MLILCFPYSQQRSNQQFNRANQQQQVNPRYCANQSCLVKEILQDYRDIEAGTFDPEHRQEPYRTYRLPEQHPREAHTHNHCRSGRCERAVQTGPYDSHRRVVSARPQQNFIQPSWEQRPPQQQEPQVSSQSTSLI